MVRYEPVGSNSGALPIGTTPETELQPDGSLRQVVKIGESALPSGAATSSNQTNKTQMTQITDGSNQAVMVSPSTIGSAWNEKGLRVLIGPTDVISNIPVIQLYDHHQLHEGEIFRWSTYVASLANAANKDIRFTVPNITIPVGQNPVILTPHFRFEVVTSLGVLAYFYEAPTINAAGTQRTPIAMERNGTYTPKLTIFEDPTNTALGTLLWQGMTTTSKQAAGSTDDSSVEFVLKNNTTYLFRATSGTNSNQVLLRFVWYEDLGV